MNKAIKKTPLRYPGGKLKFSPYIKKILNINKLDGDYIEPYAGGAGIAIDLLLNKICKNIYINDLDKAIYSFWYNIKYNTENFIKKIYDTDITLEEWHKQREILKNRDSEDIFTYGFAAFFLNRTNISGILKGGVIGGKNQSGHYKIDARFNKTNLISRISAIADESERIHIFNMDAVDFLFIIPSICNKNSFLYLDPPYYFKGKGLYRNYYTHDDHVKIKNVLEKYPLNWIASYDNSEEIIKIYSDFRKTTHQLNYSANIKKKSAEIIIFDNNLKLDSFLSKI